MSKNSLVGSEKPLEPISDFLTNNCYNLSDRQKYGKVVLISEFLYREKQNNTNTKLLDLSSSLKVKILLYFFVYGTLLHNNNYEDFMVDYQHLYNLVNCRNVFTHEGGEITEWQRSSYENVMKNPIKHYFLFIGTYCKLITSLSSYETTLNSLRNYAFGIPAKVKRLLPSVCYLEINHETYPLPDKLFPKCKELNEGDSVQVRFSNGDIIDVIRS